MTTLTAPSSSDIALGVAGTVVALPMGYTAMQGAGYLMTKVWGLPISESFTSFRFYDALDKISDAFFRTTLKAASLFYLILLIPIVEEWIFRGLIYDWQTPKEGADSFFNKGYRILANAFIFSVFHINPLQGWVNIPIFIVSIVTGIVFATLREVTQNTWASTIAHSLNNMFVLFIPFLKI